MNMRLNKFELIGIGTSVALMSLALFLTQLDSGLGRGNTLADQAENIDAQVATVSASDAGAVREALGTSMTGSKVEKLVITDITVGTGAAVEVGDTIAVNYIGTLQNGQEFDNSYKKGTAFTFTVGDGKVIKGWEQGVIGMQAGGQRILVVPANLAYGKDGFGPIPSDATLVFAIELVSIK